MTCNLCPEKAEIGAKFCNSCGKSFKPAVTPPKPASVDLLANANQAQKMAFMMVVTTGSVDPNDLPAVDRACYMKGLMDGLKPYEIGRKYMFFMDSMEELRQKEALIYFGRILREYTAHGAPRNLNCPQCHQLTPHQRCRHSCNHKNCPESKQPWVETFVCTRCGALWNRRPWMFCYFESSFIGFGVSVGLTGLCFLAPLLDRGYPAPDSILKTFESVLTIVIFSLLWWLPYLSLNYKKARPWRELLLLPGGIGQLAD